jgi:hypothetical protein
MGKSEAILMDLTLRETIDKAQKYFRSNPKYYPIARTAADLFEQGKEQECLDEMKKLPNEAMLLDKLVEKLKGKPVYKTLKKISCGSIDSDYEEMKGWFSLGTHIAIELERGVYEYGLLLPMLYEKIGRLVDACQR